jgi:drug/metabolite transporter superfamily protein YnfA
MLVARSMALFFRSAVFEIGGTWLAWQDVCEHRGWKIASAITSSAVTCGWSLGWGAEPGCPSRPGKAARGRVGDG